MEVLGTSAAGTSGGGVVGFVLLGVAVYLAYVYLWKPRHLSEAQKLEYKVKTLWEKIKS